MRVMNNPDLDTIFERLYSKLTDPDFGKNIGGELPLYIQPFPTSAQTEAVAQEERLVRRLEKKGIKAIIIDLYRLCMDMLQEAGVLDVLLTNEADIDKTDIISTLDSLLDAQSILIPKIKERITEENPQYVFITHIGRVYPFLRSHSILNNIDNLTNKFTFIFFFPGEYDSLQLRLFGRVGDENYYRGINLNEI
mgnify:CR=1 FL=1